MNHIEKYCYRELVEMQEICKCLTHIAGHDNIINDIYKIALIEINRELDERKIRKGINGIKIK